MKTELERDFEEVLASMEATSGEELAAELRSYRQTYSVSARRLPRLGEVALSSRVRSRPPTREVAGESRALSWSKLVSGVVLAAGTAFVMRRVVQRVGQGRLTSNEYVPEEELPVDVAPEPESVLVDQPGFGMVA